MFVFTMISTLQKSYDIIFMKYISTRCAVLMKELHFAHCGMKRHHNKRLTPDNCPNLSCDPLFIKLIDNLFENGKISVESVERRSRHG